MKLNQVLIVLLLAAFGCVVYLLNNQSKLKSEINDLTLNNKSLELGIRAYKDEVSKVHTESIQQTKQLKELTNSKDQKIANLLKDLNNANIKLKNVKSVGVIVNEVKLDTIIKVTGFRDTTIDLSIPPYVLEGIIIRNGQLERELKLTDTLSIVHHNKKETVKSPYKFFLKRWLQKRHNVTYVDVTHANPFILTNEQQFIIINK